MTHALLPEITITPCEQPPHSACQPGRWWKYEVETLSGLNRVSGYVPGRRSDAEDKARSVLARLRRIEGERAFKPPHHNGKCGCLSCHNARRHEASERRNDISATSFAVAQAKKRGAA